MATLVFTLVFVTLGLGVLFVAMSGGPAGARRRMASQTRRTRRIALKRKIGRASCRERV